MIQMQTRLDVADNTRAKRTRNLLLGVLGGGASTTRDAWPASAMWSSPASKASPGGDVKAGDVVHSRRGPGPQLDPAATTSYVKFDRNAVVLIDNERNPRGTRDLRRDRHASSATASS